MDLLSLATAGLFAILFGHALLTWWRRRDPLSRDVVTVFVAMAAVFVLGLLQAVGGTPPPALRSVAVALLLGQPAFTVRLTARVHRVPWLLVVAAALGWLLTAPPLALLGAAAPPGLTLGAVGVFVAVEAVASGLLAAAARRRTGAGAIRLWLAAVATALFAAAILAAGTGAAAGGARDAVGMLSRTAALLAALLYLAAFVPPRSMRAAWQAQAAYDGLRSLLAVAGASPDAVWARYLEIARGATDATGAAVAEAGPDGALRVAAVAGLQPELVGGAASGLARLGGREVEIARLAENAGLGPFADAARANGARVARKITLGPEAPAPVLLLVSSRPTLFADEDQVLLEALGHQASALIGQRRLASELAATVAALKTASEAKSDFLASMSHELRTPLNAILGFSDLMRREPADADRSVLVPLEWVEHIHRGGAHLVELVNDVLDLSRVEAGRIDLELETIEVRPAVVEVVAGLRPLADRRRQSIEIPVPPGEAVQADRGRLRQVLYNLLSNAIKFTPDGGRITVEGQRRGEGFALAVTDTGIGIAPDDQSLVFEEFRQVGRGAQRAEGTGLGLALTRRLVEAHGGRIELESTPGVGSRFTVVLPSAWASPLAPDDAHGPEPAHQPNARGQVLIVEDDPSAVRLLRAYLEPEGYGVRAASDGERALELARRERPAAILLDVLLPGVDGWEVLRRLKADAALRDVPVVIVTVLDEKDVGLALGAIDYLVKPVERDAVLAAMARLAPPDRGPERRSRILVVDDEPAAVDLLRGLLDQAGFAVTSADGGRSGVELARRDRPDLVLCDLVMPDLDGFGVVGALKADPATSDIPIIILTAHELSADDKRRLNGKVLAIVIKGRDARAGLSAWLSRVAAPVAAR